VNHLFQKVLKQVVTFICDQSVVLFYIIALGVKLYFFSTYVTKVTWSKQYMYGIVCGYVSAGVIFMPLFIVRKHKVKLATLLSFFVSFLILVDIVYYSYFSSLPTVGLLSSLGQTKDIEPAISTLLHWWLLLYFIDIILVLILFKPIKTLFVSLKDRFDIHKSNPKNAWIAITITLIAFWASLLPVGLHTLEDVFNKGFDTVSTSQYYGLLVAHGIDIVRFIEQETTHLSTSQEQTLYKWVKDNKPEQANDPLTKSAKGKNVIMIQVESLGGFVINQKVNGKEVTPNLNKLAKVSQFFPNDRFLYGAGHTSDTDFVSNTSYFPLPDAAVFVRYGQDDFTSLPKNIISNGYSAYAYHGFNRNFWNRDVALKSLGYQKFYAADNYPKGTNINMGLNDGDFLSKTADYIKKQPKPSFSYVITLSSHVPFNTNDQTKDLGINASDYPDQVGGYLEIINYTDRMIGKFFAKLKSYGLYDNSLIIVYGDHTPVLPAFKAGTIKYDPDTVQKKEVPLFIRLPNETVGKTYKNQGTHLDITPTVLDLVGIKTDQLLFGQSVFVTGKKSLRLCSDQLAVFYTRDDCDTTLTNERNISSTIIRYNQFNNLIRFSRGKQTGK